MTPIQNGIVILDFGSQFTQLIARRIRELGVYSEILRYDIPLQSIKEKKPAGIVLSGGPSSVYDSDAPLRSDLGELVDIAPVLGICYGMQLLAKHFGGTVQPSSRREYGRMPINWKKDGTSQNVWMSHGDLVTSLPKNSNSLAVSGLGHCAAMESSSFGRGFLALQFHPEVSHTERGMEILKDFVFRRCEAKVNWRGQGLVEHLVEKVRGQVGSSSKVLCALSGGVDSTVTSKLLVKALGQDRVHNVFVDTGLLRYREAENVMAAYKGMGLVVHKVDAQSEFLSALEGIVEPEQKRKTIGRVFIEVFERAAEKIGEHQFLAQGTLYPDVIESVNLRGQSVTIKSHHNVGGLPERMNLKLAEPLRELFKDEVRALGLELGIDPSVLNRHPFPGPGLAIRILGSVNSEDLEILRAADHVFVTELKEKNLYDKIWQAFVVLLPVRTVGVMGDGRTYERVAGLRAVTSLDGMTADWFSFDHSFLSHVSNRITNEIKGINRVVYDISSKPPATIEWE